MIFQHDRFVLVCGYLSRKSCGNGISYFYANFTRDHAQKPL